MLSVSFSCLRCCSSVGGVVCIVVGVSIGIGDNSQLSKEYSVCLVSGVSWCHWVVCVIEVVVVGCIHILLNRIRIESACCHCGCCCC